MAVFCGCCYQSRHSSSWEYLPQVSLKAHATILSSAARTTLTQTFVNPSKDLLKEVSYTFPLYDGVSVVGFTCRVGARVLRSQVKTKEQANTDYQHAVSQNQSAGILDHSGSASDVFIIRLGNILAGEKVTVDITFVEELKQDAQTDGIRYTLPNSIAPRYGSISLEDSQLSSSSSSPSSAVPAELQGISITVDVLMEKASIIRELQSPSHSVKIALGRIDSVPEDVSNFEPSQASATLRLVRENALLERDFVLVVKADGLDTPRALLESHPTIPGQRALMTTLVPKFSLPPIKPELVFILDRSGSMCDKIATLRSALKVFLKSLPVGVCFNMCSFGSSYSFLWPTSRVYDASSLQDALDFVDHVEDDMGGTEMQSAVEAVVKNRLAGRELEALILTDGQIWDQQKLFNFVRKSSADHSARFFSLGIGDAASHSLIQGIARAGDGFSQSVLEYEELDKKTVRMLKGALSPHIYDYKLEVEYEKDADHDFEMIEDDTGNSPVDSAIEKEDDKVRDQGTQQDGPQQPISLYDSNFREPDIGLGAIEKAAGNTKNLPVVDPPKAIQAPYNIPTLYPFIRTTVYLLLDSRSSDRVPRSLTFRATSEQGPLVLQIPIHDVGKGETIHQLAVRKAVVELEEGHGWLTDAEDNKGNALEHLHSHTKQQIAARECQRLGTKFQVTGKYCSFVALEKNSDGSDEESEFKSFDVEQVPAEDMSPAPASRFMATRSVAGSTFSQVSLMSAGSYIPPEPRSPLRGGSAFRGRFAAAPPRPLLGARFVPGATTSLSGAPARGGGQSPVRAKHQKKATKDGLCSGEGHGDLLDIETASPASSDTNADDAAESTNSSLQPTTVHAILDLQTFEGSWEWTPALFTLLGTNMEEHRKKLVKLFQDSGIDVDESQFAHGKDAGSNATIAATLLAIGFLVNKNADSKSVWELVYAKAEDWVERKLGEMGTPSGPVFEKNKGDIMAFV